MSRDGSADTVVHDLIVLRVEVVPVNVEPHGQLNLVRELASNFLLVFVQV